MLNRNIGKYWVVRERYYLKGIRRGETDIDMYPLNCVTAPNRMITHYTHYHETIEVFKTHKEAKQYYDNIKEFES